MRKILLLLFLVLALAVSTQAAIYNVYDLNGDWEAAMPTAGSAGVNPNGQWSFGNNATLTQAGFALNTHFEDWTGGGADALSCWNIAGTWPLMWHSYTYTDPPSGAGPGEFVIQSGVNNPGLNSVLRWTAPNAGLFNINLNGRYGYGVEAIELLHNDASLSSLPTPVAGDPHIYNQNVLLAAGDTIDYVLLGQTGNSNATIITDLIITEVPEPATIGLLSMGALALLRRRK